MRYLLTGFLLCYFLSAVSAQEKANTLTAKESAAGWISLFDGATTFGWKQSLQDPKIKDGVLELKHSRIETTTRFASFELRFEYKSSADKAAAAVGLIRWRDGGFESPFHYLTKQAEWTPVTIRLQDGAGQVEMIGKKEAFATAFGGAGQIYFEQVDAVRNIKLKPLGTKSLFNGKDLSGWQEFPGKKSKFTVTAQGEINVKDGPGDLQTEGKYGDFILQLDCLSNGKHLNSGIFFRCRAGEYQNGYEAQIRNQFTPEATQEYTLEEYDATTHKLIGKKKAKFSAVDYGTGAIYRRQPARKEVAKDGAWFTMTIAADGNHFATWVNGVQVTDWTDNRPPSDNARTGYRREAGHLSIQGHDPTTDLSFRNFRISALPAAAGRK